MARLEFPPLYPLSSLFDSCHTHTGNRDLICVSMPTLNIIFEMDIGGGGEGEGVKRGPDEEKWTLRGGGGREGGGEMGKGTKGDLE